MTPAPAQLSLFDAAALRALQHCHEVLMSYLGFEPEKGCAASAEDVRRAMAFAERAVADALAHSPTGTCEIHELATELTEPETDLRRAS